MNKLFLLLLLISTSIFAETPQEGLKEILNLYKTKNIDELVKKRYTELHKAKSETEVQQVIDMLTRQVTNEKSQKRLTDFFESILNVEPVISKQDPKYIQETETGDLAKFKAPSGRTYRLFKMKTGLWGFHL
jgi:hypothetical protein